MKLSIDLPTDIIQAFCQKWQIAEFALFGSVLRDDFRPDSDLDVLVSFFPLLLLPVFDEISTAYKTPFILLCALVLTAGILLYQRSRALRWRWLILLAAAGLTWLLAWHATLNYWQMVADLGYERCLPDASGCAPLAGRGRPWWALFLAP